MTAQETAFLDASRDAADAERAALAEQARRQARQNRRLRGALAGIAALLVVAVAVGAVAIAQRREAVEQRREAALSALVGNAMSLRANRRDLAALLAVEAYRLAPDAASESALFGTFTAAPGLERVVHTGIALRETVGDVRYLADGRTVVVGDGFGGVHLIDLDTGERDELPGLTDVPGWPVFDVDKDDRYLAAAWRPLFEPETGLLTVWDLESGEQRFAPITIPFRIGDVAISPDGATVVASGGTAGKALLFDAATGTLRTEVEGLPRPESATSHNVVVTAALEFAPDGRLAIGSPAGEVRFVDPATGREDGARLVGSPGTSEMDITFLSDGDVLTGGVAFERFDGATGASSWLATSEQCNSFAVAERLGALLCGEWSGRVVAFDLATGAEVGRRFDSQLGDICALAVSPGGERLVQVAACDGEDATLLEWRLDGGGPVSRLVAEATGDMWVEQFNGELLAAAYPDEGDDVPRARLIDPSGEVATFDGVYGLVPTDDPDVVGVLYADGLGAFRTVGPYDIVRRAPAGPVVDTGMFVDEGHTEDGVTALLGDDRSRLRVVDDVTGELIGPGVDLLRPSYFEGIALDGGELYTALVDQTAGHGLLEIQRRDLATGDVLATSPPGFANVAADGGIVIATTSDGRLSELDPVTLVPVGPPFPGATGPVIDLDIDAAGKRLMVRAGDDSLRFYDIATRTPIGDPIDTDIPFANAVLRDDGLAAAAVTGHGIVTWDLDPARWVEAACTVAGRNLTRDEWDRYLADLAAYRETCPEF